jgi:hypothetical protein
VFTRASHWSLSCARLIQPMLPHPTHPRSILILSSHPHLVLPIGRFLSGFPTKSLYAFLFSPMCATCPTNQNCNLKIIYTSIRNFQQMYILSIIQGIKYTYLKTFFFRSEFRELNGVIPFTFLQNVI